MVTQKTEEESSALTCKEETGKNMSNLEIFLHMRVHNVGRYVLTTQ